MGDQTRSQRNGWPLRSCSLLAVCLGVVVGCGTDSERLKAGIRPVKTTVVASGGVPQVRTFPGRVEATRRAELAFQVPGLLVSLPIKEGERIARGSVIGQLRQEDFENPLNAAVAQLEQARAQLRALESGERPEERLRREANVRSSEARLANARVEFERASRLLPQRAISEADFDRASTAYRTAQEDLLAAQKIFDMSSTAREEDLDAKAALVRAAEVRVVEAQLRLDDATLRAPYDGVIARRLVDENQNVQAKQPVVQFQDLDEIEVVADIPETVMAAELLTAEFIDLTAEFSGAPGLRFPVTLREKAQVADATTQTFQVRVVLPAPEAVRILPGMSATLTMVYRRSSALGDPILIPPSATVSAVDGQSKVWVVDDDGKVSSRSVKLGRSVGGQIEVLSGLEAGERVATAGVSFLREGMIVRDLGDALSDTAAPAGISASQPSDVEATKP